MPGYVFDPAPVFFVSGDAFEDSGVWCMGLVVQRADNGADLVTYRDKRGREAKAYPMVQAGFTAITYAVYDKGPDETTTSSTTSGTVTVSSSVFDTLQTGGWPANYGHGYNFAFEVPAAGFSEGDRWHWIEFLFDPASGANFLRRYRVWTRKTETS